jgi:4'-phosphopantetheinyl transferase
VIAPHRLARHDSRRLVSTLPVPRHGVAPLPLDDQRIDLWCMPSVALDEGERRGQCLGLLSDAERAAMSKIMLAEDRDRFLWTRATVRTVLSRYSDTAPQEWVFVTHRYGKPAICERTHGAGQPSFNLSHTRGALVLAVTRSRALGVDVEYEHACRRWDLADADTLGPRELAALARLPAASQQQRALELWTLKEAYLKARGTGFALKPERAEFEFPSAHDLVFRPHGLLDDTADRWHFWQFRLAPDLFVALCAGRQGRKPRVVLRGQVPGVVTRDRIDVWRLRGRTERGDEPSSSIIHSPWKR